VSASGQSAEKLYRAYMSFFEDAERSRRWRLEDDVPWELAGHCPRDPRLSAAAEAFAGVEMFLPDYVSQGINLVRDRFGQAWFQASWAYEESKHALVLREYLLRTGQRTEEEIFAHERRLLGGRWELPFSTVRQMTLYGALQEMTTFASYKKQEAAARAGGDALLARIYEIVARDEMAHAGFYLKVCKLLLEEDGDGTRADLAHVIRHFRMPATDLIPDWARHEAAMREVGLDRAAFFTEVLLPVLRRLGVDRRELPRPADKRAGAAPSEGQGD
jgi:acyl-[acyl-carrier-protein] desaturase